MNTREHIQEILTNLVKHAPEDEPFILASGAESTWYLDSRPLTFGKPGLVATCLHHHFVGETNLDFDAVGGPALGAVPIASAMAMYTNARGFAVRKEPKDHGADESLIVGDLRPGDRVLMVEDVVTTATSLLRAIRLVHEAGAHVIGAACLLNRTGHESVGIELPRLGEGGGGTIPFVALFVPKDLGVE